MLKGRFGHVGSLVSRKEAQLKVKRGLGVCALLGRDGAAASFSPVTVLSLAFEIAFNHVHGMHLMLHGWWECLLCLDELPQEDRKA